MVHIAAWCLLFRDLYPSGDHYVNYYFLFLQTFYDLVYVRIASVCSMGSERSAPNVPA